MNTTYFLNVIAGNVFGTKPLPALPSGYWLGLSTTPPTIQGEGVTEPLTNAAYRRIKLDKLSQPSDGSVTNISPVVFPESTRSWGTVTHYVIFDSETGGNLLMYGALSAPRDVQKSTTLSINSGGLTIQVTDK